MSEETENILAEIERHRDKAKTLLKQAAAMGKVAKGFCNCQLQA